MNAVIEGVLLNDKYDNCLKLLGSEFQALLAWKKMDGIIYDANGFFFCNMIKGLRCEIQVLPFLTI